MEHFKRTVDKNATILVHNYEELFDAIRRYSADPTLKRAERKLIVDSYIGQKVGTANQYVAEELTRIGRELEPIGKV